MKSARPVYKIKLQKGDTVIVLSGKFKGKTGKIAETHPKFNKVTIEGLNVIKRNMKATQTNPQSRVVEKTIPFWANKVAIIDPSTKKASKIGYSFDKSGKKQRVFKSSGKVIK